MPLLVVSVAQLVINSRPVSITTGGLGSGLISKGLFFLGLLLAASFVGGAIHAGILRKQSDSGISVSLLDGAVIGLLSNLIVQILSGIIHGPSLDLVMPPTGDTDPVWWIWKFTLSLGIIMIFGFMGLLSGGAGGGAGYLVSAWMTRSLTIGGKHG